jgi:hypothetical protein
MNLPTKNKRTIAAVALIAVFASGAPAGAEDKKASDDNARYTKTTTINFEDDTIEGDLSRPDGEYVEGRKPVKHSNLIRIREEFKQKVMDSVGEL